MDSSIEGSFHDLVCQIGEETFPHELVLPLFGFSAKTRPRGTRSSDLFPINMNLVNPLVRNRQADIAKALQACKITPAKRENSIAKVLNFVQ